VTEAIGFEFSGDGEHDYLFIEKTSANTEWVSRQLAAHADVPARDVGYAGLKDRHAVARQWFSVPRWNLPDWSRLAVDGTRVLNVERHSRKLRRGAHKENRFRIVIRGTLPDADALTERLKIVADSGVPNYFGEQRFGRRASNISLADDWSGGKRMSRHKRSIAISTVRSYLFNQILDARVRNKSWNHLMPGEVANLDGSGSVFTADEVSEDLIRRCDELDIHPTGLLCGEGTSESCLPSGYEAWLQALTNARVKPATRSLRLRVFGLEWSLLDDALVLEFTLSRGAFATSVLREIADIHDEMSHVH
jgi:tRNA pseudouridine13 synthase